MDDHNEEFEGFDSVQLKQDVKALGTYIRTELFQRVKFIYSSKDLEHGGRIFQDFNKNCADRVARGISAADRTRYIACLWKRAIKQKVYRRQLSTRRSGVYTVMYHRFLGEQ